MTSTDVPFIQLANIGKRFRPGVIKRVTIFDGLECRFRARRGTALLGHNGAGKTTLIRIMLGLITPSTGQVLCEGRPMRRQDRGRIGFMPEVSKMPADLTVEEALTHHLRLFRPGMADKRAVVAAKLEEVELGPHRKKRIGRLSKGLARRVAWSQATIHRPDFLILDEPFSGLDPLARLGLQKLMMSLKQSGAGMLVCTHEFWSVRELCDDLYVLNRGKVVHHHSFDDASAPRLDESALMPYFSTKE